MSAILVFENTSFKKSGKTGVMRPDASGYYQVTLGAFGTENSSGSYYPTDKVKNLFTSSSELMNRTQNGRLYGEWGHPKFDPGMTTRDYLVKLLIMHEEQISHHIKTLELHDGFVNVDGSKCLGVIGHIRPYGPQAKMVQDGFDNPEQNFCFSLRSISLDSRDKAGRLVKNPVKIVTYDAVGEPGIDVADKYHNPAVESRIAVGEIEVTAHQFTESDVVSAFSKSVGVSVGLESALPALQDLADSMGLGKLNSIAGNRGIKSDAKTIQKWMTWRR